MKKFWRVALMAFATLAGLGTCHAQFVSPYVTLQGTLSTSSGTPAANATLTFSPSQVFFVAGMTTVVTESQCGTDVNGTVVGVGNPVSPPRVSVQLVGVLPPGNYYVQFAWYDQFGIQTLLSPEVAIQLTGTGELQVLPPIGNGPLQAVGMAVYIGATPGGETLAGTTPNLTAQFTYPGPLIPGTAPPIRNLTACRVVANDAAFPTGTGYTVSLVDASGNDLFNYAELWQFFGPGSTYNLSQGIPYYHGQVTYPIPILTIPFNHNPQSISGPLSLSGYNLYNVGAIGVGTATPAWGIDVEGTGLDSIVNAKGGFLVNGLSGTLGQCLTVGVSGNYDTPAACIGSLPTLFYQGVLYPGATIASLLPQQPYLAIGNGLVAANGLPIGGNLGRTILSVAGTVVQNCGVATFTSSVTSAPLACGWVTTSSTCSAQWVGSTVAGGALGFTATAGSVTLTAAVSNSASAAVACSAD